VSVQGSFAALARRDERGALVTVLDGARKGAKRLVRADGATEGSLGGGRDLDRAADAAAEAAMWAERPEKVELPGDVVVFVDVAFPAPRLLVFGAVPYATALCRLAAATGWRSYVIDPRGRFARPERFPDAHEVIAAWPEEAVERIGGLDRATAIAVLTHDPKLDDAALTLALASDVPYIGAMGSRRTQEKRRARLLELGVSEESLTRISAPIGLDLGGLTAAEVALSIMAEIVALRHGRSGGRLAASKGSIKEPAA
jgi:xanthine dehydrogenase accessory factor